MKTNIISILTAGLLLAGAASCSDDWNPGDESAQGSVQLSSLSIDASEIDKVVVNSTQSRAVDLSDFIVTVTDLKGEDAPRTYTYSSMPEVLMLPVGDYNLEVKSHAVQPAEWDRPYFVGTKTFSIKNGEITNVGVVTCKLASIKVSVVFADDLRAVMGDDVEVTVIVNENASLVFTPNETRAGYFEAKEGTQSFATHFSGTVDGVLTTSYKAYNDGVEAGQHRIITFKTKNNPDIPEQSGKIDPTTGIQVDTSFEDQDVAGNVDVNEDPITGEDRPWGKEDPVNPGPDDPNPPVQDPVATFTPQDSPSLKIAPETMDVATYTGNAILTIECPKTIAHLVVKIDSENQKFMNTVGGMLPLEFDLAYPGDAAEDIASLGLAVGADVLGKTSVPFDITQFVGLLGGFPGKHTFHLTVTDAENKAESTALIFVAQ